MKNIIKKTLSFFVLAVIISALFVGCGSDKGTVFESDGFQYTVYTDHAELIAYIGEGSDVVVPDSLKSEKVTVLGEGLFKNRSNIKSVTLPQTVKTIKAEAFSRCTGLTLIELPERVETVENGAFSFCTGLKTVKLLSTLKNLPENAFYQCLNL